jgi:hypothetical protein
MELATFFPKRVKNPAVATAACWELRATTIPPPAAAPHTVFARSAAVDTPDIGDSGPSGVLATSCT